MHTDLLIWSLSIQSVKKIGRFRVWCCINSTIRKWIEFRAYGCIMGRSSIIWGGWLLERPVHVYMSLTGFSIDRFCFCREGRAEWFLFWKIETKTFDESNFDFGHAMSRNSGFQTFLFRCLSERCINEISSPISQVGVSLISQWKPPKCMYYINVKSLGAGVFENKHIPVDTFHCA